MWSWSAAPADLPVLAPLTAGPVAPAPVPWLAPWTDPDGDDVQVSSPNPLNQSETIIAVDPSDRDHLVAGCIDERSGERNCAFYASFDGGLNWSELFYPIAAPYDFAADPMVAIGPNGETYFGVLVVEGAFVSSAIYVGRSPDGGVTVPSWVELDRITLPDYVDKGLMAVDIGRGPDSGSVYVVYTRRETTSTRVRLTASRDGGVTWSNPQGGEHRHVWHRCSARGGPQRGRARRLDQWAEGRDHPLRPLHGRGPDLWHRLRDRHHSGLQRVRFQQHPPACQGWRSMTAADRTMATCTSATRKPVRSGWPVPWTRAPSWTTGIPVSDDASGKAQIYPAIDVDPNGNVNVGFYDRRDSNKDRGGRPTTWRAAPTAA